MCREIQELSDQVDPYDFQYYTEHLTYKIKNMIKARVLTTIH